MKYFIKIMSIVCCGALSLSFVSCNINNKNNNNVINKSNITIADNRGIVLKVNGEPIYEDEYLDAEKKYSRLTKVEIMEGLILEILTLQEAKNRDISFTDDEVQQKVEQLKELSEVYYNKAIETYGDEANYKIALKNRLALEELKKHVIDEYLRTIEFSASELNQKTEAYIELKNYNNVTEEDYQNIKEAIIINEKQRLGEEYFLDWQYELSKDINIEYIKELDLELFVAKSEDEDILVEDKQIYPSYEITFEQLTQKYCRDINFNSSYIIDNYELEYMKAVTIDENGTETIMVRYTNKENKEKFFLFLSTSYEDFFNKNNHIDDYDEIVTIGEHEGKLRIIHSEESEKTDRVNTNLTWYNSKTNSNRGILSEYINRDEVIKIANELIGDR